jgi:hypothetical protein
LGNPSVERIPHQRFCDEYKKYRKKAVEDLSPVEQAYLDNLKKVQKKIERNKK